MALITCPECGREISDKAVSCPGCGYPVQDSPVDERSDLERLVDEIYSVNGTSKVNCIKQLQKRTGMSLKSAKDIMDKKFQSGDVLNDIKIRKKANKEEWQQLGDNFRNSCEAINNMTSKNPKTPHCPKCRSTQITYGGNRPSIGRALVGGAVAGGAGAAIGGLTGKKGYAVCLNCGKRWKI